MRCISCHVVNTQPSLDSCPRCGADNRAWHAWGQAGWQSQAKRFFLRSPWGRLALVSLWLPLITWAALDAHILGFETTVLFMSMLLSLVGLAILFAKRDSLYIYELARRVSHRSWVGLLILGGAGFLGFIVMACVLGVAWGLAVLSADSPALVGPAHRVLITLVGLAFTSQALAAGLYAVYAYGHWQLRSFPRPVFLDTARLLQLVDRAITPRIQVKTGKTYEAVTAQAVAWSRTDQAGLNLKIRTEMGTGEVWEGHFLKAVQHWRVISDKWGQVTHVDREGPLEYVPDPNLGYISSRSEEMERRILEGEIILPEHWATIPPTTRTATPPPGTRGISSTE